MTSSSSRPLLVLLHALGGSARSWDAVVAQLDGFECLPLDLPGFGDAAADARLSVDEMVGMVAQAVVDARPSRWMIVGHSMGGKIATLLAHRAQRGDAGLGGLAGVVLLAASPPAPEPMEDERRDDMIGWAVHGALTETHARTFVDANVAGPLPSAIETVAFADLRRTASHAWLAWLEQGSREDWASVVGRLGAPALICAGAADEDLGEAAQRELNVPHYADATIVVVEGAKHLLPLEQPDRVAELIRAHWSAAAVPDTIPAETAALIASDRTSARTRAILIARARSDDPDYSPRILSSRQLATLRALADRVLPQDAPAIDLAARIDAQLADGPGDGWRFAALPADADAYRRGLDTLDAATGDFAMLEADDRDACLRRVEAGEIGDGQADGLSPAQMILWFEDVRADIVRIWLSHPATMARIGYDGFANGGDGARRQGYRRTDADDREGWEPAAPGAAR